jgi:aspartate aminotransferase
MKISTRAQSIPASPTLSIDARAKAMKAEGIDVISLGTGEPDFPTPLAITSAAAEAIIGGHHKYTPVSGTPKLKAAIRAYTEARTGQSFSDAEIIASCGAKHSLYNMWLALLDEGDEVLVPTPAWVSYVTQIEMAGAIPVEVPGNPERAFAPDVDALQAAVTPRTRAILINNPSNPTGALWTREHLEPLAAWLEENPHIIVISDAIYSELVYDNQTYTELLSIMPSLRERYILINGVSKAFAMTGWRLGYTLGPAALIKAMERMQSQSTSNPTAITQFASAVALDLGETVIAPMRAQFEARRDHMVNLLSKIDGVKLVKPQGAFYVFPDISAFLGKRAGDKVISTDMELSAWLLDSANVAVVPGSAFSAPGYIRMSYATNEEVLTEAVSRLAKALNSLS